MCEKLYPCVYRIITIEDYNQIPIITLILLLIIPKAAVPLFFPAYGGKIRATYSAGGH